MPKLAYYGRCVKYALLEHERLRGTNEGIDCQEAFGLMLKELLASPHGSIDLERQTAAAADRMAQAYVRGWVDALEAHARTAHTREPVDLNVPF